MKMIQGAFFFAFSNKSRTRDAPTPTNISTKSEPLIEKNGTPASPATARASKVLPVPGGPLIEHPLEYGHQLQQTYEDLSRIQLPQQALVSLHLLQQHL